MPFTCPRCKRTSHHPEDERQGYCGACHAFTGVEESLTGRSASLCLVCDRPILLPKLEHTYGVSPQEFSDALQAHASRCERLLELHLEGHTKLEILTELRNKINDLGKLEHDAVRELVLVVAAAGGVTVPNQLVELCQPDWTITKWVDESVAGSATRYRVIRSDQPDG